MEHKMAGLSEQRVVRLTWTELGQLQFLDWRKQPCVSEVAYHLARQRAGQPKEQRWGGDRREGWGSWKQSLTLRRLGAGMDQPQNGLNWDESFANDRQILLHDGNRDYWNCGHWCSRTTSNVTTASLSNQNSGPTCGHKLRTTCTSMNFVSFYCNSLNSWVHRRFH